MFSSPDLYYLHSDVETRKELKHKDIRKLLQQEHYLELEAMDLDFYEISKALKSRTFTPLELETDLNTFMQKFADVIKENKLSFPHPERSVLNAGKTVIWDTVFIDDAYVRLTNSTLSSLMEFDDFFVEDLRLKHAAVLSTLPRQSCEIFADNGNGYVIIGGGMYTWYAFLAIKSLRHSGSTLPVEIMIPDRGGYDDEFCMDIAPSLGAKCVLFETVFDKEVLKKLDAKGYQLKAMALIGASFENLMYLDSDIFTVKNPDALFTSDVYKKYGMITWPDFWRRTTSPKLYEIVGLDVGGVVRFLNDFYSPIERVYRDEELEDLDLVNFHDRNGTIPDWSTEAGLLLINKKTHFNTLLLALYYNLNGPAGYYPLLSQGGAGEGDKETWVLAAHVLNQKWWQVNKRPDKTYGTWVKDVNWIVDSCIVQADPSEDYQLVEKFKVVQEKYREAGVYNYDYAFGKNAHEFAGVMGEKSTKGELQVASDMFYHLHSPKLDPWNYVLDDLFTDRNGRQMRNFGDIWPRLKFDLEFWIWETVHAELCDPNTSHEAIKKMKCFHGRDFNLLCEGNNSRLEKRIEWLRKDGAQKLRNRG
ncbi:hypothetical protein CANINC_000238 [Pichia inconspicua]|uniref:Alpha-1,2-mannosyltransferase n=1 Tax=Pichia inconspicua TaxID=52247 RepID=A0A4V4NGA6_9ASCO|nr:hypothetical protein CANINC_000238 [[Candida] inconspicua]